MAELLIFSVNNAKLDAVMKHRGDTVIKMHYLPAIVLSLMLSVDALSENTNALATSSEPLVVKVEETEKATQTESTVRSIRKGTQGEEVKRLQQRLKALGYYNGEITGSVGSMTVEAIKRFQRANGLAVDGIAGAKTLAELQKVSSGRTIEKADSSSPIGTETRMTASSESTNIAKSTVLIKNGSQGENVLELQTKLKALGFYSGSLTGKAGSLTINAIKRFQRTYGLKVDGIAGAKTLSAVNTAVEEKTAGEQSNQVIKIQENNTKEPVDDKKAENNQTQNEETVSSEVTAQLPVIKLGVQGAEVKKLQQNLKTLGYYTGSVTGKCGTLTVKAIERFQTESGLLADGTAGASTLSAIEAKLQQSSVVKVSTPVTSAVTEGNLDENYDLVPKLNTTKELKRYSAGNDVTYLQKALKALGYFAGYETGFYGDYTQERVKMFQQDHGLSQTGMADSLTLDAINRALRNH